MELSDLLGKTIVKITGGTRGDDEVNFEFEDGTHLRLTHIQDCCEAVYIEDIEGDWSDLIGSPLTFITEECSGENDYRIDDQYYESVTWTFYKFATVRGWVDLRWFGTSNGYYSERVDIFINGERVYNNI